MIFQNTFRNQIKGLSDFKPGPYNISLPCKYNLECERSTNELFIHITCAKTKTMVSVLNALNSNPKVLPYYILQCMCPYNM